MDGDKEVIDTKYFRIGSAIDCILTTPDQWDNLFVVTKSERPQGLLGKFTEALPCGLTATSAIAKYRDAYNIAGYKINLKRVINIFWSSDTAKNFYKEKCEVNDRDILSQDEYQIAVESAAAVMNSPFTGKYFTKSKDVKHFYQLELQFEYKDMLCKGFMDGVTIDYNEQSIQP